MGMFTDMAYDSLIKDINKKILEIHNDESLSREKKDDIISGLTMAKGIIYESY